MHVSHGLSTRRSRRVSGLALLGLLLAPLLAGAQEQGGELEDVVLRLDTELRVQTPYRISRVLVADPEIAQARFVARSDTLEVVGRGPGKTEVTVYDVANREMDRFMVSVLSGEAWTLLGELRGLFSEIEGLQIGVDGDLVVLGGALFSERDLERVDRESERSDKIVSQVNLDTLHYVVLYGPHARHRAAFKVFDEFDYRAWHGGRPHFHASIEVNELSVMMLRTEGPGGQSIRERASIITARVNNAFLNRAQGIEGQFSVRDEAPGAALVFQLPGAEPGVIARVYPGDVKGYERRSPGYDAGTDSNPRITARLVAQWWRALVDDASRLFMNKDSPRGLRMTSEGEILSLLLERARAASAGPAPSDLELQEEFERAAADEKRLLQTLGGRIPLEFTG